jgi:hypothetical protein
MSVSGLSGFTVCLCVPLGTGEGPLIDATITLMSPAPVSVLSHDRIIAPTAVTGFPPRTAIVRVACSPLHAVAVTETGSGALLYA